MLTLHQAEWCPHSHRVRQRLTELGLDFVARQVSPDVAERDGLEEATGEREIPVLVFPDGEVVAGDDEILTALNARFSENRDAAAHRRKAAEHASLL